MSNADDANTPPPAAGRLLRIVAGLHAGASRELAEREMILVGSGDDCDIVLADNGVAAHHALISIVDGSFHLRALDAPLKLEGRVLHPGDPVAMDRIERVGLGDAALAFGHADDPAWLALAPEGEIFPAARPRGGIPFTRRLPMIAAIAVLSLASLAIFAAVMPSGAPPVDPEARLKALAQEYNVSGREVGRDVNGRPVLTGMVKDAATRARLMEQVEREKLPVAVALATGDDLAVNVSEVLRAGGFPALRTRYLGNGVVEVTGDYEDRAAFDDYLRSRSVVETGVRSVELINLADPAPGDSQAPASDVEPIRIVALVRGDTPYLVDVDGRRYTDGMEVPGWGTLVAIGQHAQAIGRDGQVRRIVPRPVTPEEKAGSDAGEDDPGASGPEAPRTRAYAREQTRAAAQRM